MCVVFSHPYLNIIELYTYPNVIYHAGGHPKHPKTDLPMRNRIYKKDEIQVEPVAFEHLSARVVLLVLSHGPSPS